MLRASRILERFMAKPRGTEGGSIEDLMDALNQQPDAPDAIPLVPEATEVEKLPEGEARLQPEFDLEKAMDDVMTRFEETLDYLAH